MPRVVRNFWLEADVDGRVSTVAGGPRGKDGGITLRIYQRSGGEEDVEIAWAENEPACSQ